MPCRHQKHAPGLSLLLLVCAAGVCQAAAAHQAVEGLNQASVHNRRLHTGLLIAKDQQDKWRGILNSFMGAIIGAFTKESLDAASALASSLLASGSSQSSAAAATQQPVAQLIQLPPSAPQSGVTLTTSTPVDVGAPVTVDTPVKQTNVQWGGR